MQSSLEYYVIEIFLKNNEAHMSQVTTQSSENTEDADLEFTRQIRRDLINEMKRDGLPKDAKDRALLLAALNDSDRTALMIKKIKSDEGMGNKAAAAASMLASLLNDPRIKSIGIAEVGAVRQVTPALPADIENPVVKEGELDMTPSNESYATFTERHAIG